MTPSKQSLAEFIGVPLVSVAAPCGLLLGSLWVVNSLPRLAQGERVLLPWPVCLLGSISIAVWLPWLLCAPLLRRSSTRVYLLVCLLLATYCLYFFGFADVLGKAYRRGL